MMETLITLFWIGLWVTLASIVFSIAITIILGLIAGLFGFIGWIVEKTKGDK